MKPTVTSDERITKAERTELLKIVRARERIAKNATVSRAAEIKADFEAQLARRYVPEDDPIWAKAYQLAEVAEKVAQSQIEERCKELHETALYRRQHLESVRVLYDFEAKLIKTDAAREKLVDIDRLNAMIAGAIAGGLAVMRRLPELGRDPEERRRLEEFGAGAIKEFERGGQLIV
jgi:hypothetical protein